MLLYKHKRKSRFSFLRLVITPLFQIRGRNTMISLSMAEFDGVYGYLGLRSLYFVGILFA